MHSSEKISIGVAAAAVLVLTSLWLAFGRSDDTRGRSAELVACWKIEPSWEKPAASPTAAAGGSGRLAIYIDKSQPMGGFLAPDAKSTPGAFEAVLRAAPDHLLSMDQGASSPVAFFGVAENLEPVGRQKVFKRSFYGGGQSRIDKALAEIRDTLPSGETEAALVVTDLIATGDAVGAGAAARVLREIMEGAEVRSGRLHVGLLGVKDVYWGVRTASCAAPPGKRGCRFSEQSEKWLPLEEDSVAPFYVLVFARGHEPVERILDGLGAELAELDLESEKEILSETTRALDAGPIACTIEGEAGPGRPQFALRAAGESTFSCGRSEKLLLNCPLPPGSPAFGKLAGRTEKWLAYSLEADRLELKLDCGETRDRDFPIAIQFAARRQESIEDRWAAWSSNSDVRPEDVGRTLRLKEFLVRVRLVPESHAVEVKLSPESAR